MVKEWVHMLNQVVLLLVLHQGKSLSLLDAAKDAANIAGAAITQGASVSQKRNAGVGASVGSGKK
jgi:hypothetical protein